MSAKATALNASANNSPTNFTMNTSATSTTTASPTVVKIKKEMPSDEIKEFAESTMNELLGWYGFDSVDRLDLSAKTSKLLQTAGIVGGQQPHQTHNHQTHHLEKRRSRANRAASLLHIHQQQQQQNEHLRSLNNNHNNTGNSNKSSCNNINNNNHNNSNLMNNRKTGLNCNNNSYRGNDSASSDHDTKSLRDDDSKSPNSIGKTHTPATNIVDDKLVDYDNCRWCRRPVPENAPEFLTTCDGPRYCSESCFTQSRRASFKKAKTCDWCKHVRHAISYVDFQDGASQLQFCSDKCLNQYKMQIFCKETQAHLDMNPHLKEQGLKESNNVENLITPDLWLRNCRGRSASPEATVSISPVPLSQSNICGERVNLTSDPIRASPKLAAATSLPHNSNTSHKPLISVAPVSKLMSNSPNSILQNRQSPKPNRKKRPSRACVDKEAEMTGNSVPSLAAAGGKKKPLMTSNLNQSNSQTLTQFATSCVQDLQMNVPPLSPLLDSQSSQPTTPHSLPPTPNRVATTMPPAFFATPPNSQCPQASQPMVITPQCFAQPPAFFNNPNVGFVPRFLGNFAGLPPSQLHNPTALMPPDLTALNTLIGTPPPVTVMVPYPVIIPLPIPIPVPLPIVDFYKAHLTHAERQKYDDEQQLKKETETNTTRSFGEVAEEEPLDFTKTKEADVVEHTSETNTFSCSIKEPDLALSSSNTFTEKSTLDMKSTTSEDSATNSTGLHCVLTSERTDINTDSPNDTSQLKADFVASSQIMNEDSNEIQSSGIGGEINQKLPKLKITRLQTKRTLIQTKESECSRPLRKRKRIIDCDFQKLGNSNNSNNKEASEVADELHATTENEQTNKQKPK